MFGTPMSPSDDTVQIEKVDGGYIVSWPENDEQPPAATVEGVISPWEQREQKADPAAKVMGMVGQMMGGGKKFKTAVRTTLSGTLDLVAEILEGKK